MVNENIQYVPIKINVGAYAATKELENNLANTSVVCGIGDI